MNVRLPTLAEDGYCLQVAGWGDFGPVPLYLDGAQLVCAACVVRPATIIRLVHVPGELNQAARDMLRTLRRLDYPVELVEAWWQEGKGGDG